MPLRMTTRSAGRQTTTPQGGRMGGGTSGGGGRTKEPTCRVGGGTGDLDGQGGDQGIRENGGVDEVHDFSMVIAQQLLVPYLVTLESKSIERYIYGLAPQMLTMVVVTEPTTIQSAVLKAGMLTDEAIRNGSLRKNTEKRGIGRELSRNKNVRDDNKKSRIGRAFAIVTNPIREKYTVTTPKCTNCSFHHNLEMPCRAPRTLSKVQSFLGLAGYYRRFIKNFSKIAKPLTILTQKNKTYVLGEELEDAFHILKDKLCNAPILALPDRPEDFVNWVQLYLPISTRDTTWTKQRASYTPTTRVSSTSLIKKELNMRQHHWIELFSVMTARFAIIMQPKIPEWKWERIAMNFVMKLPRTSSRHDAIWIIVDRINKSAHFILMREDYNMDRLARLYLNEIVARHGVTISIISDRDDCFTSRVTRTKSRALISLLGDQEKMDGYDDGFELLT
nr:reverse transcriptase domain-containing protein [Tanacetum cinerariifolium]